MNRIAFLTLLFAALVIAAELGRIQGTIRDDAGSELLIGVSVVVEGTEVGASSDENGVYVIPFVPVGNHTVTASYMGYGSVSKKNVIVNSGQTTLLDFRLTQGVISLEPVVVVADKPIVVRTQTQTSRTSTAEDISRLPISEINQIVTLQAGVSQSELGTHIRGGRSSEIAYYVDGVLTKAPHYGDQSLAINKEAVEEIGVITGGFDAEYGEALSGVVNIVTREGSDKSSGMFRWTTDEIFTSKQLNHGYNLLELSLGGAVTSKSRLRYFLSGESHITDAFQEARYVVSSPRFDYKAQGKLSYRLPNAKGKVIASGFIQREMYEYYSDMWGDISMIYHLDHRAAELRKGYLASLTMDYMPSKSTVVEGKIGYTRNTRFYSVRDLALEEAEGRQWYEDYIFKANHFPELLPTLPDSLQKYYLIDSLCDTTMSYHFRELEMYSARSLRRNPYGATGFFYTIGDDRMWRFFFNRDIQANITVSSALGNVHELKSGISMIFQNVGWYDNNLPWTTIPFWDAYNKNPIKGAFFVQDRMDFEGIITRIGFRFDYFDSKASGLKNPTDITDTTMVIADPKWRVSPRFGFSMPITEKSKFRFNYGHFYQTPTAHDLYRSTEPEVVHLLLRRYNSVLGNPNLTTEKTISYEIGYENELSELLALGVIAYYKDIYDLIQTERHLAMPYNYYQVSNLDYGNVKGAEITFKKRMADLWSFDLSYTMQFARGTASSAWQNYYEIYNAEVDPITGEYLLPKVDYWLNFDERHIINSNVGIELPRDFSISLLREFAADFLISYHSGFPYTPTDSKGNKLGDDNSARMPGATNVDAHITKGLSIMGLKLALFSNIYNMFNSEHINSVYSTTGEPDDDGQEATILVSNFFPISIASAYYTPQADYDHDGINEAVELHSEYIKARRATQANPFNWGPGFRIRMGITMRI